MTTLNYHLAQINIAQMLAPLDAPIMASFVAQLDKINALPDESPGFIWRLQSDEGDATSYRPFGDDMLVNMSVWEDHEALRNFVFGTAHVKILRRRREWFEKMQDVYTVLWWVPVGYEPTIEEAGVKLEQLRVNGPGPSAFDFKTVFERPVEG